MTALIVIFNFILGTACLMYGVNLMSSGLENANSRMLKKALSAFTRNVFAAFLTGTLITGLCQSSTAVTVITVGLVNSGLLDLSKAAGIIYGANLGTTVTAQLMSLNITKLALPLLAIGLVIRLLSKKASIKSLALAIIGMGFMLGGLAILNSGVPLIRDSETAYRLFRTYGRNPVVGLILGMVASMLVHSGGATIGLTIVLFNNGLISFDAALGLTFGSNIGTCITAQMASIGTSLTARRTAWAHTLYNVFGVIGVLMVFKPFMQLVLMFTSMLGQDSTKLVANAHTLFNLASALVFLPITKLFVRFIERVVR